MNYKFEVVKQISAILYPDHSDQGTLIWNMMAFQIFSTSSKSSYHYFPPDKVYQLHEIY